MSSRASVVELFRWLLFLPAAFAGAALAQAATIVGNTLATGVSGRYALAPVLLKLFVETVGAAVFGGAFVWAGARVAPRAHEWVAFWLACFFALLGAAILAIGVVRGVTWTFWEYWAYPVGTLSAIAVWLLGFAPNLRRAPLSATDSNGPDGGAPMAGCDAPEAPTPTWPLAVAGTVLATSLIVTVGVWALSLIAPSFRSAPQATLPAVGAPSSAPEYVTVPNVVGMQQQAAVEALSASGLRASQGGGWYYQTVHTQNPSAGSQLRRGGSVLLWAE